MKFRVHGYAAIVLLFSVSARAADPLPSWNDTATKKAITAFVEKVSAAGSPEYVPIAERIAVCDNDGTLWAEQPAYFQLLFAIDRVRQLAPQHPEWVDKQPFKAVLDNDMHALAKAGEHGLLELLMTTHAGMTTDEFAAVVRDWLHTARHPTTGRPYTEMVYQPMLELLAYLRTNGFKTFIVSGGGIEFMRVFAEEVYGVPPEQVIGSSIKTRFELRDGQPVLARLPELNFIDDKAGKPVGIHQHIGRRPIAAFGNSDGDLQMLQWTAAADGLRLCLLVHHTDAAREWAYDRDSHIGQLDQALEEAGERNWVVVDMQADWARIYPAAGKSGGHGSRGTREKANPLARHLRARGRRRTWHAGGQLADQPFMRRSGSASGWRCSLPRSSARE